MKEIKTFRCKFNEIQENVYDFLTKENANLIDVKFEKDDTNYSHLNVLLIYEKNNTENLLLEVKNNDGGFIEKVDLSCDYRVLGHK